MDITQIIIGYILGLATTGILFLIDYLKKKKYEIYYFLKNIKNVLDFIEKFILDNPELVKEPWAKFKKKFIQSFEYYTKIDLTDETWNFVFKLLYEKYKEIKKKLEEEEEQPPSQEEKEIIDGGD